MAGSIWSIAKKEFSTYFSSPVAFIFLGTFSAVCLFIFFWVEQFFARNIVDARPLFDWMPILLIFLSAALTMKMWSEERRMETLESLFTMPVKTLHLVLGKFFACLGLVAIALVLTVGVPLTVSFMGPLDWGPVLGAYTASLLLAAAYCSIGLYISSRNESQIASLILTTVIGFLFYLLGSLTFGSLVGHAWAEYLGLAATGVRFESITRGILDLRGHLLLRECRRRLSRPECILPRTAQVVEAGAEDGSPGLAGGDGVGHTQLRPGQLLAPSRRDRARGPHRGKGLHHLPGDPRPHRPVAGAAAHPGLFQRPGPIRCWRPWCPGSGIPFARSSPSAAVGCAPSSWTHGRSRIWRRRPTSATTSVPSRSGPPTVIKPRWSTPTSICCSSTATSTKCCGSRI